MIERAFTFGPDRALVGIWCEPTDQQMEPGTPAVIISNSGIVHHCGVWRLHVRLARALAGIGIPSLRFDLSGIGDSDQAREAVSLDEMNRRDFDAAIQHVREVRGRERIVMLGLCSGARDSLETAERHREVVGVVAIDLIARIQTWQHFANHFGRRFFRLESWKNTFSGKNRRLRFLFSYLRRRWTKGSRLREDAGATLGGRETLTKSELDEVTSSLLRSGTEFLFLYSNGVEHNYNHLTQFAEALPHIAAEPTVAVDFFPDADHTFRQRDQQQVLISRIVRWMGERFPSRREESKSTLPGPKLRGAGMARRWGSGAKSPHDSSPGINPSVPGPSG